MDLFRKASKPKAADDRRLLTVQLVSASGFVSGAKDFIVSLALKNMRDQMIQGESFNSSTVKGPNPTFNSTFTFGNQFDLNNSNMARLVLTVSHKPSRSEEILGLAVIELENIQTTQSELHVPLKSQQGNQPVPGELFVKLSFNRAAPSNLVDLEAAGGGETTTTTGGGGGGAEGEYEEGEEYEEEEDALLGGGGGGGGGSNREGKKNCLRVKLISAKGLIAVDRNYMGQLTSSDPIVTLSVTGQPPQESIPQSSTLNPIFPDPPFKFLVESSELALLVEVKDGNRIGIRKFLGRVSIPMLDLSNGQPLKRAFKLLGENNEATVERGEITMEIQWIEDIEMAKKINEKLLKKKSRFSKFGSSLLQTGEKMVRGAKDVVGISDKMSRAEFEEADANDDEEDDQEGGGMDPLEMDFTSMMTKKNNNNNNNESEEKEEKKQETEEEKKEREEKEAEMKKDLSDIDIRTGDYQIQVHIIEARDLASENQDGTSSPIVFVETFNQKQNTKTIHGVTSCVFDEALIFNVSNVDKTQFEQAMVSISVKNASSFGVKKAMIGQFVVDCSQVYTQNKDHEMYRQWVPLIDNEDEEDVGVQGYLKISIQIIGPGEKMKVHDEASDISAELAKEASAGGDISSLLLSVPVIRKEWKFLVVSLIRCEGLPVMDGKMGMGGLSLQAAKTDAFCQLQFGGGKPLLTKVHTVTGDSPHLINPSFNCEMWYPISIPTMTQMIKFSVWDHDADKNELIGVIYEKLNSVTKSNTQVLKWYNMYGTHEFKQGKILENAQKIAKSAARKVNRAFTGEVKWGEYYNNNPEKAVCFKGRALLGFRLETPDNRPPKQRRPEMNPFMKGIKTSPNVGPSQGKFSLKCIFFLGNNLPAKDLSLGFSYSIKVMIGNHFIQSASAEFNRGSCNFNAQISDLPDLMFPGRTADSLKQIPDIFIYLMSADKPICYTRFSPLSSSGLPIGFDQPTKWYQLQEDKALDALSADVFPGSLLMKVGFGPSSQLTPEMKNKWNLEKERLTQNLPSYQVRVHLFQCKNLPAADSNGLSDPEIEVSFMGHTHAFQYRKKTLFPSYYESYTFPNLVTLPNPENLAYAFQPIFRLYDRDDFNPREYLGNFPYPLEHACVTTHTEIESYPYFMNHEKKVKFIREFKSVNPDASIEEVEHFLDYKAMEQNNSLKDLSPDSEELKKYPRWYSFFKEVPGDGQGQCLVHVQLIPAQGMSSQTLNAIPSKPINPATRPACIELIAIGCRELSPYQFQPIQAPYLEIKLDSFGSIYHSETKVCKKPSPQNPNFLEKIEMEVVLPYQSIFSSPMQLSLHDRRLGGFLKPVTGVGIIDLSTKLPWCPDTYIAPQSDSFIKPVIDEDGSAIPQSELDGDGEGEDDDEEEEDGINPTDGALISTKNNDPIARRIRKVKGQRQKSGQDELLGTEEPPSLADFVASRAGKADTGAGIFGALQHIKQGTKAKLSKEALAFAQNIDWKEDDSDQPPDWAVGRRICDAELEDELKTTPFETYPLLRGKVGGFFANKLKQVGVFKGLVRVMNKKGEKSLTMSEEFLKQLMKPQPYKIRLYCLNASRLAKMDKDIKGNAVSSDPYLRVRLGKQIFNDREHAVNDADDVDLYKVVEFDVPELPGVSQLVIDMMDKDTILSDDLIGRTIIDLEDRWFDKRWQDLGIENKVDPSPTPDSSAPKPRFATRPIENRVLKLPGQSHSQGSLRCWLDILTPEQAIAYPPDNVALPPVQTFEVRVVVWKSRDVPAMDSLEGMSDLFMKVWPEGCKPQETDTHWRCKKGKASWNYRLLFDVELGHSTRAMKFPYLHFQLWDRDLLKWNDCAGEVTINLAKYYRKAYKRNIAIKMFEEKKGTMAIRDKKKDLVSRGDGAMNTDEDLVPDEPEAALEGGGGGGGGGGGSGVKSGEVEESKGDGGDGKIKTEHNPMRAVNLDADSDDDDDIGLTSTVKKQVESSTRSSPFGTFTKLALADDKDKSKDKAKTFFSASSSSSSNGNKKGGDQNNKNNNKNVNHNKSKQEKGKKSTSSAAPQRTWTQFAFSGGGVPGYFWSMITPQYGRGGKDGSGDEDEDEEGDEETPLVKDEEKTEEEDQDLIELISTVKGLTGLWDVDPPDSSWLSIEQRNHNTDEVISMGNVSVSVQIWPKDKAALMPSGPARQEPNTNPYLPPPVGRLKWSWNPFILGSELCGPVLCGQLFCCLICVGFILLMIFCQPFLNIIINLIFVVF